jgi:hypothetical protein
VLIPTNLIGYHPIHRKNARPDQVRVSIVLKYTKLVHTARVAGDRAVAEIEAEKIRVSGLRDVADVPAEVATSAVPGLLRSGSEQLLEAGSLPVPYGRAIDPDPTSDLGDGQLLSAKVSDPLDVLPRFGHVARLANIRSIRVRNVQIW